MAFAAKDGKKFSMSSRMRAHNSGMEAKGGMTKPQPQILDAPGGEADPMADEQDGAEVAAQHGPASHVDIEHPAEKEGGEGGMHHVHSMHPDGHEHHSDHGSKEEAHEHAKKLAGMGAEEEHGEPDGDEGEPEEY